MLHLLSLNSQDVIHSQKGSSIPQCFSLHNSLWTLSQVYHLTSPYFSTLTCPCPCSQNFHQKKLVLSLLSIAESHAIRKDGLGLRLREIRIGCLYCCTMLEALVMFLMLN